MKSRRIRRQNRIFKINKMKLVLPMVVLVIILVTVTLVRFNVFTISSVEVSLERIDCTNLEQIKNSSKLLGQNFFLLNSQGIENSLKNNFLCVRQVQVSRLLPNRIKLNIFGRIPAAILIVLKDEATESAGLLENFTETKATVSAQASPSATEILSKDVSSPSISLKIGREEKIFVVDTEGVIYSNNIEQIYAPQVFVKGFDLTLGEKISDKLINDTLRILEKINSFGLEVKEVEIYSKAFLLVNGRTKIIFLLNDRVDKQIASLQLIYDKAKIDDKTLEFIDLRFDKPVIKFAPKK